MRIKLLRLAIDELVWWRNYYGLVFPDGRPRAEAQLEKAMMLVFEHPALGRPVEDTHLLQHPILRTPFALIYRRRGDTLEVARIWDTRRDPDTKALGETE